jgi:hypothetical protein
LGEGLGPVTFGGNRDGRALPFTRPSRATVPRAERGKRVNTLARGRFHCQPGYRNATLLVPEATMPLTPSAAAPVVGTFTIALAATCNPPVAVVPAVTLGPST